MGVSPAKASPIGARAFISPNKLGNASIGNINGSADTLPKLKGHQ